MPIKCHAMKFTKKGLEFVLKIISTFSDVYRESVKHMLVMIEAPTIPPWEAVHNFTDTF